MVELKDIAVKTFIKDSMYTKLGFKTRKERGRKEWKNVKTSPPATWSFLKLY